MKDKIHTKVNILHKIWQTLIDVLLKFELCKGEIRVLKIFTPKLWVKGIRGKKLQCFANVINVNSGNFNCSYFTLKKVGKQVKAQKI